jgi:hypothetical protein
MKGERAVLVGEACEGIAQTIGSFVTLWTMLSMTFGRGWSGFVWSVLNPLFYLQVIWAALRTPLLWSAVAMALVGLAIQSYARRVPRADE